jgi:hypothetical protein
VVTPLEDQQVLAGRIVGHWTRGAGGDYNPNRREALEQIRIHSTLAQAVQDVGRQEGSLPQTVATCARPHPGAIGFDDLRRMAIKNDDPYMILLGTAWGLAPKVIDGADLVLASIGNHTIYNHLSVRCAAAIILDRLTAATA